MKYIANHENPKKPVVTLQVPQNMLGRTASERNESQQGTHFRLSPMRVELGPLHISALRWKDSPSSADIPNVYFC